MLKNIRNFFSEFSHDERETIFAGNRFESNGRSQPDSGLRICTRKTEQQIQPYYQHQSG